MLRHLLLSAFALTLTYLSGCQAFNGSPLQYAFEIQRVDLDFQLSPDTKTLSMALLGWGNPPGVQTTLGQYFTSHYLFDINTGDITSRSLEVQQEPAHQWSPDGKQFVYAPRYGRGQLAVRDADFQGNRLSFSPETCQPFNFGFQAVRWSPDSRRLACVIENAQNHWEIQLIDGQSGQQEASFDTQIALQKDDDDLAIVGISNLVWLDQNQLLINETNDFSGRPQTEDSPLAQNRFLWVDLKAQTGRVLHEENAQNSQSLAIHPEKKTFLYDSIDRYRKIRLNGKWTSDRVHTDRPWPDFEPSAIYRYDLETETSQRLTEGFAPQWSPDGKRIAFLRGENALYLMNADGEGAEEIFTDTLLRLKSIHKFWWLQDGQSLLLVLTPDSQTPIQTPEGKTQVLRDFGSALGLSRERLRQIEFVIVNTESGGFQFKLFALNQVIQDLRLGQPQR